MNTKSKARKSSSRPARRGHTNRASGHWSAVERTHGAAWGKKIPSAPAAKTPQDDETV
jgi:hypothetical protein